MKKYIFLLLIIVPFLLLAQSVPYRIVMPGSTYSAQLRGVSGTRTSGLTITGGYSSTFKAHVFIVSVEGRYNLYYDASGGSTYTLDTGWSGSYGKYISVGDFQEAIDTDNDNKVDQIDNNAVTTSSILDSNVTLPKLSTAAYNYIGSGGNVVNNPDDVTIENSTPTTLGVKDSSLGSSKMDSTSLGVITRYDTPTNRTNNANNLISDYSFEELGVAWAGKNDISYITAKNVGWVMGSGASNPMKRDSTLHGNWVWQFDNTRTTSLYYKWITIDPNTQYTFSYYRKATIASQGAFSWTIEVKNSSSTTISTLTWSSTLTASESWNKQDTTFTTGATGAYVRLTFSTTGAQWGAGDEMSIDFLGLFEGSTTPNWVNTQDNVSRRIYNTDNWFKVKMLESDNLVTRGQVRLFGPENYTVQGYEQMFTVYNKDYKPVFWFDKHGYPWIANNTELVYSTVSGVSGGHWLQGAGDYMTYSPGTTNGLTFFQNRPNGTKKLTFWQKANTDSTWTMFPGIMMFGMPSNTSYLAQSQMDTLDMRAASKVIIDLDSTVIRNPIKYNVTTGKPLYPQRNQFFFLNSNPIDADTISVYNGYVWKEFISDTGAFEAETDTLLGQMLTQPSTAQKQEINFLISALKSQQIYQKLDVLYVFANDTVDAGQKCLLNWAQLTDGSGKAFNATNNSMTFRPDTGVVGNGSSQYINTNWSAADSVNYGRDDLSIFMYSYSDDSLDNTWDWGAYNGTSYLGQQLKRAANSNTYSAINNSGGYLSQDITGTSTAGLFVAADVSQYMKLYVNGYSTTQNSLGTRAGTGATDVYIGALNNNGAPGFYTTRTISVVGIGASLTAFQHRKLHDIINKYMTTVVK